MHTHTRYIGHVLVTSLVMVFGLVAIVFVFTGAKASALSGSDFSAGNIVDDSVFYSHGSMSANDIQAFLNAKVPTCDTNGTQMYNSSQTRAQYGAANGNPAPYTCLKDYSVAVPSTNATTYCAGSINSGTKQASLIIYEVAQACGINPQVLLVLLQKEQALVTDTWPWPTEYQSATGYGCPDTAACDSTYYGFFNQVYQAATAYKRYAAQPANYSYRAGRNNTILYNPQSSCGSSSVYVQDQATADLYIYTPYQPNQAALANLYGTGDACSAYGNRNFWRLFNDWFGSTRTTATVYTTQYANMVDANGAEAKIGFSLSQRPLYEVDLVLTLSNTSVADFYWGNYKVVIQPENWNNPAKNTITIVGKSSTPSKSTDLYLGIAQIGSGDTNFSYINPDFIGKPMIVWQPTDSAVYRLFSPTLHKHTFASRQTDIDALTSQGYQLEGAVFTTCNGGEATIARYKKASGTTALAPQASGRAAELAGQGYVGDGPIFAYSINGGTVPIYEAYNATTDDYIYTSDLNEANALVANNSYVNRGVAFNTCSTTSQPVFRLFSAAQQEHFYTISPVERDRATNNGFSYEGVGFYTTTTGQPVYRLFSPSKKEHFYTTSTSERDTAASLSGYVSEGTSFYVPSTAVNPIAVYRLFSNQTGKHFYTLSASERTSAQQAGYTYEGTAFTLQK